MRPSTPRTVESSHPLLANAAECGGQCAPSGWRELFQLIEGGPGRIAETLADVEELLSLAANHGVGPAASRALVERAGSLPHPPEWQAMAQGKLSRYKAVGAVLQDELSRILHRLQETVGPPIVLKGAQLALECYPAFYLRSMSDIDLLYEQTSQAERARALLLDAGFEAPPFELGRDSWRWGPHLPALKDRRSGVLVELHSSLIVSPGDRRYKVLASLWRQVRFVQNGHCTYRTLEPEANLYYLLSHMWAEHVEETPRLSVLYDVGYLMEREWDRFDWDRFKHFMDSLPFSDAAQDGLATVRDWAGGGLAESLDLCLPRRAKGRGPRRGGGKVRRLQRALAPVLYADFPGEMWRRALLIVFPPRHYMVRRYPERDAWPLWALYGLRWWNQCTRLTRILVKRAGRQRAT